MAGKNVQFRSDDSVLKAFDYSKCNAWAICLDKQFMFKHVGDSAQGARDVLADYLDMIADSKAIYTLKVFDGVTNDKLNERTPCSGSFNFRLSELTEEDFGEKGSYGNGAYGREMLSRLSAIEEKLKDQDLQPEEKEPSQWDTIGEIISHPTIQPIVQNILGKLVSGLTGAGAAGRALGAVPEGTDRGELLKQSINILREKDPKLPEHMHMLASMATNNPQKFNMLVGMLENF